jgi:hypothetical protein
MRSYQAHVDLVAALSPPEHCPVCRSQSVRAMSTGDGVAFLCGDCWHCWRPVFGALSPVDPHTCTACSYQSLCLAAEASRTEKAGV